MAATKKTKSAEKPLRLIVLDSHAIIHRAYHALPDFSTSKGEPTGALYGLTSILLKMAEDLKPDYLIATRDLPGQTHRHEVFGAYKATRKETEEELVSQLKRAPEIFEAFGIPMYSSESYEADDIIGTIVSKVSHRSDIETIISSGDMDMLQLVSDRVRVYTMRTGLNDLVLFDTEAVREKYGFGPERVVDYKGIKGDTSDNIPGVKGVGDGSASKLITTYGSLENIYAALRNSGVDAVAQETGVQKRFVKLVAEGEAQAQFSRTLATIHTNAPIQFELPKRRWVLADHADSIAQMCDELEFRSLKERMRRDTQTGEEKEADVADQADHPAVDPQALKETALALWILHSDLTNPGLDDILHAGNTDDFARAREIIFTQLRETGRLQEVYDRIEHPLTPIIERMNADGVHVDVPHLKLLSKEYGKDLGELAGRIYKYAGHEFNINSPKQLGDVLYDELKINPPKQKKTAGGQRTTREEELIKLSPLHPIIADVLAYRELQKLLSTYIDKMPALVGKDSRLHAEFLQAGAATGRMASQDPNLQNIPVKTELGRRIRTAFGAPKGRVIAALDYSQIELRIAAGLSGDEKLVGIFKSGGDVHAAVAAEVFDVPPEHVDYEMRRRAKVINFGILYGMGVNALRTNLGADVTREEAAEFLSKYFKDFSGLARYIERTKADAAAQGYTETLFGRRRYFPAFKSALPNLRAQAERMAINAPIQGTQADIIKLAMIEADKLIEREGWREKAKLVLQVHDELVYELDEKIAEKAARMIREVMENVAPSKDLSGIPIIAEASMGPNWGDRKKIER